MFFFKNINGVFRCLTGKIRRGNCRICIYNNCEIKTTVMYFQIFTTRASKFLDVNFCTQLQMKEGRILDTCLGVHNATWSVGVDGQNTVN